jgi:hypothetical protein
MLLVFFLMSCGRCLRCGCANSLVLFVLFESSTLLAFCCRKLGVARFSVHVFRRTLSTLCVRI